MRGLWYFWDGRWNPAAQRPARVYAHMGNVLGKPFRNPAFTVLKAHGFFPREAYPDGLTYPQFMAAPALAGLEQRLRDSVAANETVVDGLVRAMREEMGKTGNMATDMDLKLALESPHLPMNLTFASGPRVVRHGGLGPEGMTWQLPGVYVNLYYVRQLWADRAEPAPSAGSHDHGRASAPVAG